MREEADEGGYGLLDLSDRIVSGCENDLCLDMRFLIQSIMRLRRRSVASPSFERISTDGTSIYADPEWVIGTYREEPNEVTRAVAHSVMHCILGHHETPREDPLWNLACDIVVEYILDCLDTPSINVEGREDRLYFCERYIKKIRVLSPERLLTELKEMSEWKIFEQRRLFVRDDHSLWAGEAAAETDWKEMSEQVMTDIEGFTMTLGERAGSLMAALRIRCRRRYDYKAFLRKFMTRREVTKESLEEFDYIYYSYGMSVYGNMPLIDSLEYSDDHVIDEFVIVVDTSGSTMKGAIVSFLEGTYDILEQTYSNGTRPKVHVIQCDDRVRKDTVITARTDMDSFLSGFEMLGGGGTDFRPAFDYVDSLMENGALRKLKGLVYFTDGMGTYPRGKPDYDSAFVFYDKEYNDYDVPAWAMKIVVEEQDMIQ